MNRKRVSIATLLALVLFAFISCAENPTETMNPPLISNPKVYPIIDSFPVWSPDGKRLIYDHAGVSKINIGGSYIVDSDSVGLWIINQDGTNPHLLVKGGYNADWSPDGNWIAFESGGQIYKVPFAGDSVVVDKIEQLTFEGRNFFPSISPDGEWIAYDSDKDSPNGMKFIWKMKNDGTSKTRIAYDIINGEIRMPSWSHEGNRIVHIRYLIDAPGAEIFIMDCNGLDLIRITHNDSFDGFPKFSYDGNKIVFEADGNTLRMDSDGTNLKQLTVNGGLHPNWSPNGQKIAYVGSSTLEFNPTSNGTIYIINTDGGDKHQLTYGPK